MTAQPRTPGPKLKRRPIPPDLDSAMRENYRLRHELQTEQDRTKEALRELAHIRSNLSGAGVAGDRVYGRMALADARATRKAIRDAILNFPDAVRRGGRGVATVKVVTDAREDLALLGVDRSRGPIQAALRDQARRCLTHPAWQSLLLEDAPSRITANLLFSELVSDAYSDAAYARIFERSPEIREGGKRPESD